MEEENKNVKIYHVRGWNDYSNWIEGVVPVETVEEADIVFFLGGEDVSPDLYGQIRHATTVCNRRRDMEEVLIYRKATELNKKILGVCRGSQFICAMQPRGMLVQHQPNPGYHDMLTIDGKQLRVSSTHHQAQYPYRMNKKDYKIIGWTENMLKYHLGGEGEELAPKKECEIVYYPRANALGIQHHPEIMDYDNEANVWLRELLNKFMKNEL